MPPTERDAYHANILNAALARIKARHGYAAAVWCALWTVGMEEDMVFKLWRDGLMCPWLPVTCQREKIGAHGDESKGVPKAWGRRLCDDPWNCAARGEAGTKAMSCGLCGHLERKFGKAPVVKLEDARLWPAKYSSARYAHMRAIGRSNQGEMGWDNPLDSEQHCIKRATYVSHVFVHIIHVRSQTLCV